MKVVRVLYYIFIGLTMMCIIIGRIKSFHMTEGEALVYNWPYWVGSLISAIIACLLYRRPNSEP